MNELDLARTIRDGAAPSPSRCGNAWLFAIRISGTGIAERKSLGETAYRPPEVWVSPEMQQRAAGLPVILGHPPKKTLDGAEYVKRVVGAVVLPYAQDGELCGIARVFDEEAAADMASGEFSTSPCADFGPGDATRVTGADSVLLIERDPGMLDHVAVIPNKDGLGGGVWDKGGPGAGIRIDSTKESVVAEESKTETDDNTAKEHGEKLDKLLGSMAGIADMCTSMGKRLDALEKPKADAVAEKPENSLEPPAERIARERDEAAALADIQARCDAVAIAHGQRAPAPLAGEWPRAYRERVLRLFQRHSKEYGKADLHMIPDGAVFDGVERSIYADAVAEANNPTDIPEGKLREIRQKMPGGGEMVTFKGSWNDAFAPFRVKPRKYMGHVQQDPRRVTYVGAPTAA